MPTIQDASKQVNHFPNLFISPYGNDGVIPLYSSIPIDNRTSSGCLPCVLCGNSVTRDQVVSQQGQNYQSSLANGIQVAIGT